MNYYSIMVILAPLIIGYLIQINHEKLHLVIHKILSGMVYIILFFMGISLALLDDLSQNLILVFVYASSFFICISSCNFVSLVILNIFLPWEHHFQSPSLPSTFKILFESIQLCSIVTGGFLLGLTGWHWLDYAADGSTYILILLLFLIGIQLRNNGMTLRQIMLNRRGTMIALTVLISGFVGGAIAALLLTLPIRHGLAIASGFGWYSLSGSMLTKSLGPVLGSTAFFNDLARELIAIILIPFLVRKNRTAAIGICGATSMDFTLPILQRSGGIDVVPAAIVNGFILSLLAPIFMAFFS